MRDDAWLAGFTDGEGSFQIASVGPRFVLILRADDLAVLEQIKSEFGGSRIVIRGSRVGSGGNQHPTAGWSVTSKKDLLGLVSYFDRFPLRAKKARDYAIWRVAVSAYVTKGRTAAELSVLKGVLEQVRAYPENTPIPIEPTQPNEAKTRCPAGHLYEGTNLYANNGRRYCRQCRLIHRRECDRRQSATRG